MSARADDVDGVTYVENIASRPGGSPRALESSTEAAHIACFPGALSAASARLSVGSQQPSLARILSPVQPSPDVSSPVRALNFAAFTSSSDTESDASPTADGPTPLPGASLAAPGHFTECLDAAAALAIDGLPQRSSYSPSAPSRPAQHQHLTTTLPHAPSQTLIRSAAASPQQQLQKQLLTAVQPSPSLQSSLRSAAASRPEAGSVTPAPTLASASAAAAVGLVSPLVVPSMEAFTSAAAAAAAAAATTAAAAPQPSPVVGAAPATPRRLPATPRRVPGTPLTTAAAAASAAATAAVATACATVAATPMSPFRTQSRFPQSPGFASAFAPNPAAAAAAAAAAVTTATVGGGSEPAVVGVGSLSPPATPARRRNAGLTSGIGSPAALASPRRAGGLNSTGGLTSPHLCSPTATPRKPVASVSASGLVSPRGSASASAAAAAAGAASSVAGTGAEGAAAHFGGGLGLLLSPSKSAAAAGTTLYSRYSTDTASVIGPAQILMTSAHGAAGISSGAAVRRLKASAAATPGGSASVIGPPGPAAVAAGGWLSPGRRSGVTASLGLASPIGGVHSHFARADSAAGSASAAGPYASSSCAASGVHAHAHVAPGLFGAQAAAGGRARGTAGRTVGDMLASAAARSGGRYDDDDVGDDDGAFENCRGAGSAVCDDGSDNDVDDDEDLHAPTGHGGFAGFASYLGSAGAAALAAEEVEDAVAAPDCRDFNGLSAAVITDFENRNAIMRAGSSLGRALLPVPVSSLVRPLATADGAPLLTTTDLSAGPLPAEADYHSYLRQASASYPEAGGALSASALSDLVRRSGNDYLSEHRTPQPGADILQTSLRRGLDAAQLRAAEIPQCAVRTLEAPNLRDDFYHNTLDWSARDVVTVALHDSVYNWSSADGDVKLVAVVNAPDTPVGEKRGVTGLKWDSAGDTLAIGLSSGEILLVDRENNILRTYTNLFERRVANFSWTGSVLAAGGKDSKVHLIDTRTRGRPGECAVLRSHDETPTLRSVRGRSARLPETSQKEICGLSWSESGRALAVGSNNNRCCIWDAANLNRPRLCFSEASAAVKSLAWSPHNPEVLVTGAGTADRCLRVYNTASGTLLATNHTGSQVSSVHWSRSHQELVSTHGFSTNAVKVWQYPSLRETASLEGHRERIITSALSPDGSTLCTASADETLRFWRLWDPVAPAAAAGAYSTTTSGVLVQTLGREHSDGGRGSTGSGRFPGSSAALKRHYGSIVGGSIETENDHAGLR